MIIAAWRRWIETGQWWWVLVLAAVVLVDALIGSWLIAKELQLFKDAWS